MTEPAGPHVAGEPHVEPDGTVKPHPARKSTTTTLFIFLGIAILGIGIALSLYVRSNNHSIDSRGKARDAQRQADIRRLQKDEAELKVALSKANAAAALAEHGDAQLHLAACFLVSQPPSPTETAAEHANAVKFAQLVGCPIPK